MADLPIFSRGSSPISWSASMPGCGEGARQPRASGESGAGPRASQKRWAIQQRRRAEIIARRRCRRTGNCNAPVPLGRAHQANGSMHPITISVIAFRRFMLRNLTILGRSRFSVATNKNRPRYEARHFDGGTAHEKDTGNFGDGCRGWRNHDVRAGASARLGLGTGDWYRSRWGRGGGRRLRSLWALRAGLRVLRLRSALLRAWILRLLWPAVLRPRIWAVCLLWRAILPASLLAALVIEKARSIAPGFWLLRFILRITLRELACPSISQREKVASRKTAL